MIYEYEATVELYRQGETEEKPIPVPLCTPVISTGRRVAGLPPWKTGD
jgi:hypothetical protein